MSHPKGKSVRENFMEDSIFANIPREGETLEEVLNSVDKELEEKVETEEVETEKPAESQPEKEEIELPDLKQNDAWKEMRLAKEESEAKARALEERLQALEKGNSEERSEFIESLVGDNEDVDKIWSKEKQSLKEEVKRELLREQEEAQKKEKEQKEYWSKWTADQFAQVEKEFKVDFKSNESLKNELSKVMNDYTPTDDQGNLDFKKGMKILNELNKVKEFEKTNKVQAKKNIADSTISKETSVDTKKDYYTSNDLKGRDWRSLIGS